MFKSRLTDSSVLFNKLLKLQESFKSEFNLTACLGAELEFYILNLQDQEQISLLQKKCGIEIKSERGVGQYEIEIPPSTEITYYPDKIISARKLIEISCDKVGLKANFSSKPFIDDFGSSMHIHLNFLEENDVEKYASILCHFLPSTIKAFLPNKEDYKRLDSKFMAPTHISYGGNNRTTLIRIPDSYPLRIEHRLAGSNADPYKVIYAILSSIYSGLKYPAKISKFNKIHGNAFDKQYNLMKI